MAGLCDMPTVPLASVPELEAAQRFGGERAVQTMLFGANPPKISWPLLLVSQ